MLALGSSAIGRHGNARGRGLEVRPDEPEVIHPWRKVDRDDLARCDPVQFFLGFIPNAPDDDGIREFPFRSLLANAIPTLGLDFHFPNFRLSVAVVALDRLQLDEVALRDNNLKTVEGARGECGRDSGRRDRFARLRVVSDSLEVAGHWVAWWPQVKTIFERIDATIYIPSFKNCYPTPVLTISKK